MMGKNMGKIFPTALCLFACATWLSSQSLVEIAKEEKERRAVLKASGVTGIVVTNADLKKQKRLPIVAVPSQIVSAQDRDQSTPLRNPLPAIQSPAGGASKSAQNRDVFGYRKNAAKVLFSTGLIKNPDFALNKPDGQYAEISIFGVLELEFYAENGPGADIAIFARLAGAGQVLPGRNEDEGIPVDSLMLDYKEGFWYGVLVLTENGEWEAIGKGLGKNGPDKFDLGRVSSISKIRIMFKPHTNADLPAKFNRIQPDEFTFGIDAVEALH